jgi:2-polyprenyl-6-methoxyphenol hydroxylase-like FAD-dependent oxidoreductase
MQMQYDIVTIGGGLGGAALATVMARRGARVLVLERETAFRDRVRGEVLVPWGSADLDRLGLRSLVLSACGTEHRWWDDYLGSDLISHRDTVNQTPGRTATLAFPHPRMQETLLAAAADAGAEVRRGGRVTGIAPGRVPAVRLEETNRTESVPARLVVAADGRDSLARHWAGFVTESDRPRVRITGVLLGGMDTLAEDTTRTVVNPRLGRSAILIPQGGGRARCYVVTPWSDNARLTGERDLRRFIEEAVRIGLPAELFGAAHAAGPLATFEAVDRWVEQPYRNGVALIGDAAATNNPSWGQGLALTVRDVRVLADALTADDDWHAAGKTYATAHDAGYATMHATTDLLTTFFLETGPEADARRERALPLIAADPSRVPDGLMAGPDAAPVGEHTRARFFGEM